MGKTNLEIMDFEDKESNSGVKYTLFETSEGKMSCWDAAITKTLKESAGDISVDVKESPDGNFKNIRKIYGDVAKSEEKKVPQEIKVSQMEKNKQAGVATRYAVDLCIGGKIALDKVESSAKEILKLMNELAE